MIRLCFVVLVVATSAFAEKEIYPKFFHGFYRAYLETYVGAHLPESACEELVVVGSVRKPGVVAFSEKLTVTKAIELAGGFGDWADKRHVGLWNKNFGCFTTVDATAVQLKEAGAKDPEVEKRDAVVVIDRHM
jgi:SLBB domain